MYFLIRKVKFLLLFLWANFLINRVNLTLYGLCLITSASVSFRRLLLAYGTTFPSVCSTNLISSTLSAGSRAHHSYTTTETRFLTMIPSHWKGRVGDRSPSLLLQEEPTPKPNTLVSVLNICILRYLNNMSNFCDLVNKTFLISYDQWFPCFCLHLSSI